MRILLRSLPALGSLPPRVRAERFVDYVALLPHIDLIVHHGGCGTTTGAWAHGVPQLVWPHGLGPGHEAWVTFEEGTLKPGPYSLICWVPADDGRPHLMNGMFEDVTVG